MPFYYRLAYKTKNSYSAQNKTQELISLNDYDKDQLKRLKIVSNAVISTSNEENVLYQFDNLIYKVIFDAFVDFQEDIKGYIDIDVGKCFIKPYTVGLIHYLVLDEENDYIELDKVPITANGVRYTIDSERTYCVNNGKVLGYDSTLGIVNTPEDDECYIYFTKTS